MAVDLTPELALRTLRGIVDEYGYNYVYPRAVSAGGVNTLGRCAYVHGIEKVPGTYLRTDFSNVVSGCIIGHLLHDLGFTFQQIAGESAEYNSNTPAVVLFGIMEGNGLIEVDDAVAGALDALQRDQDCGMSWGVAVGIFEEVLADSGLI